MTREHVKVSHSDRTQLQERLHDIIHREFGEVDLAEIALALEQLSSQFEKRARANQTGAPFRRRQQTSEDSSPGAAPSTPSSDATPSPASARPARHASELSDVSGAPEISVVAEDESQIANLLHQIVNIGALMMRVDEPVKLNEFVSLIVEYAPLQFTMEITGRVVNISRRGTAIEVMKLNREDRATLERIYQDYQHLVGPELANISSGGKTKPPERITTQREAASATHGQVSRTGESLTPYARLSSTLNEPRMTMRRQVPLTPPDEDILQTSSREQYAAKPPADGDKEEFYGPQVFWLELREDPDRIEELAEDRVLDILLQLSGHGFSGMMELEQPSTKSAKPVRWQLLFDSGFLVQASRRPRLNRVELGHMLALANRVEHDEVALAAAHSEEQNLSLERAMLELDLLSPDTLRHAIAGRLTFLLRLLCNTNAGTVRVYDQRRLPTGFLPAPPLRVHVPVERTIFQLLFEKLRQLPSSKRQEHSQAELDSYPEVIGEETDRVERSVSEEEHVRFIERVKGGKRRLREVITESALSGAETFAVLFALHRMGLLRFDRSLHHTVVRERFRENVTVKYLSVHKASYFEVLNVHWSSYDEVIERAYRELIDQFDPSEVPDALETQVHQRVRDIRERVESAYQVLAKREHRHAYRTRIMPEYKLAHAIPLFLKQTELAERRSQWEEAKDSLLRLLEIDPTHETARKRLAMIERHIREGGGGDLGEVSSSAPM